MTNKETRYTDITQHSFAAHLDVCDQCRNHPFELCEVGTKIMKGLRVISGDGLPAGQTLAQHLKQLQGETERLRDLVRFSRHQLLSAGLITGEEYASLAPTADVLPRLVSYDELRAQLEAADVEIRKLIAERDNVKAAAIARIRAAGFNNVAIALEHVLDELPPTKPETE